MGVRRSDDYPLLARNPVTYAGAILAAASFMVILFLLMVEVVGGRSTPYVGVLLYIALPALLVLGLLLVPIGIAWNRWRLARAPEPLRGEIALRPYPSLDLNDPQQRRGFLIFSVATVVFAGLLAGTSYRAYNLMDSNEFCGLACHQVMQPEWDTYQRSPHARVNCTACHIGPGADWFVRSKLSGVRQVVATTFNTYPRPIPAPIRDLRPARETCETCHWPEKFHGDQLMTRVRYAQDEANTQQVTTMVVKTGGGGAETGVPTGIHWHTAGDHRITYAALDRERQKIPWVRQEGPAGQVIEYFSKEHFGKGEGMTAEQLAALEKRTMDCLDCHNRPTHIFRSPDQMVDQLLAARRIERGLPFVKKQAVELLSRPYPDHETAGQSIASGMLDFYRTQHPQVFGAQQAAIQAAIRELQQAYRVIAFPTMKVDWRTYADNIGHQQWPGCFRCHDGKHVSPDGQAIRSECGTCHSPPTAAK